MARGLERWHGGHDQKSSPEGAAAPLAQDAAQPGSPIRASVARIGVGKRSPGSDGKQNQSPSGTAGFSHRLFSAGWPAAKTALVKINCQEWPLTITYSARPLIRIQFVILSGASAGLSDSLCCESGGCGVEGPAVCPQWQDLPAVKEHPLVGFWNAADLPTPESRLARRKKLAQRFRAWGELQRNVAGGTESEAQDTNQPRSRGP